MFCGFLDGLLIVPKAIVANHPIAFAGKDADPFLFFFDVAPMKDSV